MAVIGFPLVSMTAPVMSSLLGLHTRQESLPIEKALNSLRQLTATPTIKVPHKCHCGCLSGTLTAAVHRLYSLMGYHLFLSLGSLHGIL